MTHLQFVVEYFETGNECLKHNNRKFRAFVVKQAKMENLHNNKTELPLVQDINHSRAKGVWRYFYLLVAGWIQFTLYFLFRGYQDAVYFSCIVIASLLILYLFCKKADIGNTKTAAAVINTYLAIHSLGVFVNAVRYPSLESNLLAIPIAMTIVYMLLGMRAASGWLLVSLAAFLVYPVLNHGFKASYTFGIVFDDTILKAGACIVLFLCLKEFEGFFSRREKTLFKLSQKLEEKTDELRDLATTDTLTGLPNRFSFNATIEDQVKQVSATDETLTLLMLDMDGFKQINDTLGHVVGDEALCAIADRIRQLLGDEHFIARLGGDEFCILIRNPAGKSTVKELSSKLHERLCELYCLSNVSCQLGVSIGIASYPADADSPENLLTYADTAMFFAKENHQAYAFYRSEQTKRIVDYCVMREKLSEALQCNEFKLVYQPQFEIHSGKIIAAEALLRWSHDGENISPAQFIPHLETSRQIIPVTKWVLDTVCAQLDRWNQQGIRLKIAVNISAVDFHDSGFIETVAGALVKHKVNPDQLELEITEGVLIDDLDGVSKKLSQLKQQGISLSIDDFGTGYSSLAYIHKLPVDKLKIDRAFIKNIPDSDDGIIATTVVFLAQKLGKTVLAEGVETEAQLQFLKNCDCHQYQGFLSSKPIDADQLLQRLLVEDNKSFDQYRRVG